MLKMQSQQTYLMVLSRHFHAEAGGAAQVACSMMLVERRGFFSLQLVRFASNWRFRVNLLVFFFSSFFFFEEAEDMEDDFEEEKGGMFCGRLGSSMKPADE
jgi:hypothetical protein